MKQKRSEYPKNLFITGPPRSGKTTLVKHISQNPVFRGRLGGFFTEEKKSQGKRTGFNIVTIPDGEEGDLARKNLVSKYRVGAYGVCLEDLEQIACPSIRRALTENKTAIIDEIGKMEIFSQLFRRTVIEALNSPHKVLATITRSKNTFADGLKKRLDVRVIDLSQENFPSLLKRIESWLKRKT